MPKIKHIAISTQDVDKTAKFYIDVFGMKEIAKLDGPGAKGYYLSDGDINLAILNFKSDAVAGAERGKEWSGIHHIGFQVESLETIAEKLAEAGSQPRDDVNQALGVGHGRQQHGNVEVKYSGLGGDLRPRLLTRRDESRDCCDLRAHRIDAGLPASVPGLSPPNGRLR